MLLRGLEFTIMGMLVVFFFLFVLVGLVHLVAVINRKLAVHFPEEDTEDSDQDSEGYPEIAAALAAVTAHRNNL